MDRIVSTLKASLGLEDIRKPIPLIKSLVSEMLGTALLVIIGLSVPGAGFGIAAMGIVFYTGHISGAHINPAVSLGAFVGGQLSLIKFVLYSVVQFIGAIIGAAIVLTVSDEKRLEAGWEAVNRINPPVLRSVTDGEGKESWEAVNRMNLNHPVVGTMLMEIIGTMCLVIVVLGSSRKSNIPTPAWMSPRLLPALLIGSTLAGISLLLSTVVGGCGINPARSFGAAVVAGEWEGLWVFFLGPFLGGILGGLLDKFLLDEKKEESYIEQNNVKIP